MIPGVVCAGAVVVDVLTRPVEKVRWDATVWVDEARQALGGNGKNTSCGVSRVARMSGETAVSTVLVRGDGARVGLYWAGVSRELFGSLAEFELAGAGFRHFHLSNVFNLVAGGGRPVKCYGGRWWQGSMTWMSGKEGGYEGRSGSRVG